MSYYFSKQTDLTFAEAIEKTTNELKKEGFGVLTEIDVKATLKKKLDVDFRNYKILGTCNPPFAYEALQNEEMIGLMLPCNVVVQETKDGKTTVAAIDTLASMSAVKNVRLGEIAHQVQERLKRVVEKI